MNKNMCSGNVKWCGEPQNKKEILFRAEFNRAIESSRQQVHYQKKKKRFRSLFTTDQVLALENEFRISPYVNNAQRRDIAARIKISEKAIKVWFQNRRMKEKQKNASIDDDMDDQRHCLEAIDNKSNLNNSSSFNEGHDMSLPVITYEAYPNSHQESINKRPITTNYNDLLNNEVKVTNLVYKETINDRQCTSPVESLDLRIKRKSPIKTQPNIVSMKEHKQDDIVTRTIAQPRLKEELFSSHSNQATAVPTGLIPVYYNRYITPPYLHGNTSAWQPLNIMPLVTAGAHSSMAGGQNPNECYCNCHKKGSEEKPPAQHIVITMPPYDLSQYQHLRQ